jgi:hypothetical protein
MQVMQKQLRLVPGETPARDNADHQDRTVSRDESVNRYFPARHPQQLRQFDQDFIVAAAVAKLPAYDRDSKVAFTGVQRFEPGLLGNLPSEISGYAVAILMDFFVTGTTESQQKIILTSHCPLGREKFREKLLNSPPR